MSSGKKIYDAAQAVIDKCAGHQDPYEYAAFKQSKLEGEGDVEGAAEWLLICQVVQDMMKQKSKPSLH